MVECQLPKLDVAGSSPVARFGFLTPRQFAPSLESVCHTACRAQPAANLFPGRPTLFVPFAQRGAGRLILGRGLTNPTAFRATRPNLRNLASLSHPGHPTSRASSLLPMPIHPTAIVDPRADIAPQADIGPYVVIDGPVRVGAGSRVLAHAVLSGWTEIGEDNVIHMGAVIGHEPQDLDHAQQQTCLKIGHRNVFREHSQVHRGTTPGSSTVIGDDNYLMQNAHVAHNCQIGNQTIIAGGALLAGYVQVADRAFVSGNCVVHQFVRIGTLALLRGLSRTSRDVPPFCIMDGTHTVRGLNRVGLHRAGFNQERIRALHTVFGRLFRKKINMKHAIEALRQEPCTPDVLSLLDFIQESRRGVCFGPRQTPRDECSPD